MMNDHNIRKAVIPIAGSGTRMFPETFFIKKALLPVPGKDGAVKPALLYMLEELDECGIEEIYLIVGEGEEEEYYRAFHFDYDDSYEARLPQKSRVYYRKIFEIGRKVRFIIQKDIKGFGHAVYQANEYLNGEPCVLLLGDFLYKSSCDISCTRQMIDAFDADGERSVVGIREIPVSDSRNYGVLCGDFRSEDHRIMYVNEMVEKPDEKFAADRLLVEGKCYATFGNYILTSDIFGYVGHQIDEKERKGDRSETDLTSAFSDAAGHGRLLGVLIEGRSYDIGLPEKYVETFMEYGK